MTTFTDFLAVHAQERFGAVLLLDALGTRTATMEQSRAYLEALSEIKKDIDASAAASNSLRQQQKQGAVHIGRHFFGDSILVTYEIGRAQGLIDWLTDIELIANAVLSLGLTKGVLFRGALAVGRYVESDGVILGPAVADAAAWYETPQLVAVMLTPAAVNYVCGATASEDADDSDPTEMIDSLLMRYGVATKAGPMDTYVLAWPEDLVVRKVCETAGHVLPWYYTQVQQLPVPTGAESKFTNTAAFIAEWVARFSRDEAAEPQERTRSTD